MMKFRINDACIPITNVYNSGLAIRSMVSPSVVINNINGVTSTNVYREMCTIRSQQ